eukprot:4878939-Pleurochrysis_carterae.AAC.4
MGENARLGGRRCVNVGRAGFDRNAQAGFDRGSREADSRSVREVGSLSAVRRRRRASATRRRAQRGNSGPAGRRSAVERSIRPASSILRLDRRALSVDSAGGAERALREGNERRMRIGFKGYDVRHDPQRSVTCIKEDG